jgi:hypothetical protein
MVEDDNERDQEHRGSNSPSERRENALVCETVEMPRLTSPPLSFSPSTCTCTYQLILILAIKTGNNMASDKPRTGRQKRLHKTLPSLWEKRCVSLLSRPAAFLWLKNGPGLSRPFSGSFCRSKSLFFFRLVLSHVWPFPFLLFSRMEADVVFGSSSNLK